MHHVRPRTLLALGLAAAALAACGDDGSSGSAPTAADLDGRQFVATDIEGYTIVDGSEVLLSFEEGRISIEAGCNVQNSGYAITDGVLEVELLAATMMACEDSLMEQDQVVASIVTAGPTVELDGDDLTISSDDTTMSLTART